MYRGSNLLPKIEIAATSVAAVVGEYSYRTEAVAVRRRGVVRSNDVGISNKKLGYNPNHRKSKGSWATRIDPGLVDPKQ